MPSLLFRDRLSGTAGRTPPSEDMLFGRWVVAVDGVFLNSAPAAVGDCLYAMGSGRWRILADNRLEGRVARARLPDRDALDSVVAIAARIERLSNSEWLEWLDIVPLVPDALERIELQPREAQLEARLGALTAICHRPRTSLQSTVERVAVHRARRLAPRAASWLAAHSEDWERPTIRGVRPRRVLAEVRDEQLDIYENRVVARLLDALLDTIEARLRAIRRLIAMFEAKDRALGGTWLRRNRVTSLWGAYVDTGPARSKAQATIEVLERLAGRLRILLDSKLYGAIPRRARVGSALRSTNILTNDERYAQIEALWRVWIGAGQASDQRPEDTRDEAQRASRGFDAFGMLLVVRALDQLGYGPREDYIETPIVRGGRLVVEGRGRALDLRWQSDGAMELAVDGRRLRVVLLATDLGAGDDAQVADGVARLHRAAADCPDARLLVLYLSSGQPPGPDASSLHTVGNDHQSGPDGFGCLPVSPWSLGTTERVARALRWFLATSRFSAHPHCVDFPAELHGEIDVATHGDWLSVSGLDLTLRRPPTDFEWQSIELGIRLDEAAGAVAEAADAHDAIAAELRSTDRRSGRLRQRKSEARATLAQHEAQHHALVALYHDLTDARARSLYLLVCPGCGRAADARRDFEPRRSDCFRCQCSGCHTIWELRVCPNGHRYPVMLPGAGFIEPPDQDPGWYDRVYGCDLLALPRRQADGAWGFGCPVCGHIS